MTAKTPNLDNLADNLRLLKLDQMREQAYLACPILPVLFKSSSVRRLRHQLHSKGRADLGHSLEARMGIGSKCLIESLSTQPSLSGDLGHAACPSHYTERVGQFRRIIFLNHHGQIGSDCFLTV